jgi:phosphoglycolate phosphatase
MTVAPTILYDLDGTLVDTKPGIQASILYTVQEVARTRGVAIEPPTQKALDGMIGPPMPDTLSSLVGPDHVAAALEFYRERYDSVGALDSSVYPGIPEALALLKARGHTLFVATSKLEIAANLVLDRFGLTKFFAAIYGSARDGSLAHKPELLAHVLAKEALDPSACVMIGDRKFDMLGAIATHVAPIGALWGYGSREELLAAGATRLIATPHDIGAAFEVAAA